MNSATAMLVKEILENGWYRKGTTLGESGWSQIPPMWKYYELFAMGKSPDSIWHTIDAITAKDDQTAVEAFHSLFHMDEFVGYEICEKVTEYRIVETSNDEE